MVAYALDEALAVVNDIMTLRALAKPAATPAEPPEDQRFATDDDYDEVAA